MGGFVEIAEDERWVRECVIVSENRNNLMQQPLNGGNTNSNIDRITRAKNR